MYQIQAMIYPISAQCYIPHKNQSFDFQYKTNDSFLYEMQHWTEMSLT